MKLLAYMRINDQMAGFLCKYGKVDGFTFNWTIDGSFTRLTLGY